jgi:hypothetical protein
MTLKTQMVADLSIFYNTDEFAVSVVYTQTGSSPKISTTIKAHVIYGEGDEYRGADQYGVRAQVRVKAGDIAQPQKGDEITIGADTWIVIGEAERVEDGLEWTIPINKRSS